MTISTAAAGLHSELDPSELNRIARTTGFFYLGLAITGVLGFMMVRNQIFVAGDAKATLANVLAREGLARVGIVLEMGIALTQALTALWFYRLFRSVNAFAAASITALGLVNAVAILGSAAMLASALDVATSAAVAATGNPAATVQMLYLISANLWGVSAIFFGLWLIPMGWLIVRSAWLPIPLGWTLMVGGVGYVLGAFVGYLFPDAKSIAALMPLPATVGEFWIIGYLIVRGVRVAS